MSEILNHTEQNDIAEQVEIHNRRLNAMHVNMTRGLVNRSKEAAQTIDGIAAGQHILDTGPAGLAKTHMARNFADMIEPKSSDERIFGRFQGTEDKLPADALGSEIYDQRTNDFRIRKGPIFSNIFLVDEINRASTKTQAGINEAAEEGQVTIGDGTLLLPKPFIMIATRNDHEYGQATNPMSDALIDRFGVGIDFVKPTQAERDQVARDEARNPGKIVVEKLITIAKLTETMNFVSNLPVEEEAALMASKVVGALVELEGAELVTVGHRSTIKAIKVARAHAVRQGKAVATTDDVKAVLPSVLTHRVKAFQDDDSPEARKEAVAEALKAAGKV